MAKKYTEEKLEALSRKEVIAVAQEFGIKVVGLDKEELIEAIMKKQSAKPAAEEPKKAAPKKAAKKVEPEEEEEEEEDDEEKPAPKKGKKAPAPEPEEEEEDEDDEDDESDEEDEDEESDDEEEEEEEEEPAPAKKPAKAEKPKTLEERVAALEAAVFKSGSTQTAEVEEEEIEVDLEALPEMDAEELVALAKKIGVDVKGAESSPRLLRKRITDFLAQNGSVEEKEESDEDEEVSTERLAKGTRIKTKFGDDWYKGTITKANKDGTYAVEYDDGDVYTDIKAKNAVPLTKQPVSRDDE